MTALLKATSTPYQTAPIPGVDTISLIKLIGLEIINSINLAQQNWAINLIDQ